MPNALVWLYNLLGNSLGTFFDMVANCCNFSYGIAGCFTCYKAKEMIEIIKDIPGYEGLYQVSNLGYVNYMAKKKGTNYSCEILAGVMKGKPNGSGYLQVALSKQGNKKHLYIHRIIASLFVPNPDNKKEVNHIDGDKLNNCFNNLEWVNRLENEQHAWSTGLKKMVGKNHFGSKPVIQMDMQGNELKIWDNAHQVKTILGFHNSHISNCCNGKLPHIYGYKWKFA